MIKIIEKDCAGCGICANICPEGIEMVEEVAKIKKENADCLKDVADACPRNAILIDGEKNKNTEPDRASAMFGQGRGMGRGQGAGRGQGRGLGPRDGRGMGRGGGGRRW